MSLFGWSLPAGCTLNDIDELCGEHGPSCFCDECLGEPPEESENEMNLNEYGAWTPTTYERIPYAPHNSTMHDERCDCPWCMPGEPDGLSDEEAAWEEMDEEREAMESFNEVPSYFERYQDLQANRRFFLNEEEFARDDAHDLAEMIQVEELRMAEK